MHKFTRAIRFLNRSKTLLSVSKRPRFYFNSKIDNTESDPDFQSKKKSIYNTEGEDKPNKQIEFTDEMTVEQIHEQLGNAIKENEIVLFMKGSPQMPMCGYSRFLAETLKYYQVPFFAFIDVLSTDNLRQEVKVFSDWPTFPQLYVKGEFIGGSDIVMELHKDGNLSDILNGTN